MRLKLLAVSGVMVVVTVLSGCTQQSSQPAAPETKAAGNSEVVLVPARKSEESSKRELVVEKDGTFYEMLKEHERLCHDCDR